MLSVWYFLFFIVTGFTSFFQSFSYRFLTGSWYDLSQSCSCAMNSWNYVTILCIALAQRVNMGGATLTICYLFLILFPLLVGLSYHIYCMKKNPHRKNCVYRLLSRCRISHQIAITVLIWLYFLDHWSLSQMLKSQVMRIIVQVMRLVLNLLTSWCTVDL